MCAKRRHVASGEDERDGVGGDCPDFARAVREADVDGSLFEQITGCFAKRLSLFARYYCRDDQLGFDAFQDAMMAAMNGLDGYRGDAPIEGWLRRIVATSCARLRRGLKNDPSMNLPMPERDTDSALAGGDMDQELRLMMAQSLTLVGREIEALGEPNRTLLVAHDLDEVPIDELSRRFSMTEEAVKSRLKRARAQIRERLVSLD